METKHTPGPWEVDAIDSTTIQIKAEGAVVAEVASASAFTRLSEEQRANARLIAAAPELLDALQNFADQMDGCMNWPDTTSSQIALGDIANIARAAIAKAT